MPILNDIMDHKVIGREYKRGREEGRQRGETASQPSTPGAQVLR